MSKGRILFQLSGSIACFKSCQLLSKLSQSGYDVEVVASASALEFVGEATLEGLTGKRVHSDVFAAGEYMKHIHLIRWADLILLCPATANTINKLSHGIGDDLISTLFLAHDFKKPYLIAPAMNVTMLEHPATQKSLKRLKKWGVEILESGSGSLACGEIGAGRLMEPDELFSEIDKRFRSPNESPLKVLITSGGTQEPIDGVRAITNFSTGEMGARVADRFAKRGHSVTLLHAKSAQRPRESLRAISFISYQDLRAALTEELAANDYDVVIHAAAVSDYSIAKVEGSSEPGAGKIDSVGDLTLRLQKTPKLVDSLRDLSRNKEVRIVAFKLTNTEDLDVRKLAVEKLAKRAHPDFIVHNDLTESTDGKHHSRLVDAKTFEVLIEANSKSELADALESLLSKAQSGKDL